MIPTLEFGRVTDPAPAGPSLATAQVSLKDRSRTYPLSPVLTRGCPETSDESTQYPLAVDYDYDRVDPALFEGSPGPGLERWAPLLPPLDAPGLGAGATPVVSLPAVAEWAGIDGEVYLKDESRNPTWSQKDRLARVEVSAAVREGAPGVVASSSGNHGAAVAAHAARAGLDAVVLTSPETAGAVQEFIGSYGAAVVGVPDYDLRRRAVDRIADEHGYHPTTTRTADHTGHPFGPEGYKTIAYELYQQVGVPGTVLVPTAHAELLYGVWKGFRELSELGIADRTPAMVACEPGARAPLAQALDSGEEVAEVDPADTGAYSIRATRSTYRGRLAIEESDGFASPFPDAVMDEAQSRLARTGIWQESSGAAGVAGLRSAVESGRGDEVDGPVVCLGTSSGFKDGRSRVVPEVAPEWDAIENVLSADPNVGI